MKKQNVAVIVCITTMLLMSLVYSCKKQDSTQTANGIGSMPKLEPVDQVLLKEYTDLEQLQEANRFRGALNGSIAPLPPISYDKYNAMIDNYLTNERNNIRVDNWRMGLEMVTTYEDGGKCYDAVSGAEITCPANQGGDGGSSVSCTGTFDSWNSASTIVFSANMSVTGSSILESGVAFGGVTGTFREAGPLGQSFYDGVVTYSQIFTETYTNNGVTYTQVYRVYGNVNQGRTCTVHALRVRNTE